MVVLAVATIPFMLYAYFKQLYGVQRFEMVQSYLSNILPIFMQKPKYRYALEEVADMSNGLMNKVILHSLEYIDTNTKGRFNFYDGMIAGNVAIEGEVCSRSTWEMKLFDNSVRSASSSCVRLFSRRRRRIFFPISMSASHPYDVNSKSSKTGFQMP